MIFANSGHVDLTPLKNQTMLNKYINLPQDSTYRKINVIKLIIFHQDKTKLYINKRAISKRAISVTRNSKEFLHNFDERLIND